jgi:hypothetical protein
MHVPNFDVKPAAPDSAIRPRLLFCKDFRSAFSNSIATLFMIPIVYKTIGGQSEQHLLAGGDACRNQP